MISLRDRDAFTPQKRQQVLARLTPNPKATLCEHHRQVEIVKPLCAQAQATITPAVTPTTSVSPVTVSGVRKAFLTPPIVP